MSRKPKLELTWIGKEERPRLEPRILIEDSALSHHAATRRDGDSFDNMLIQGDNLLALKALARHYGIDDEASGRPASPHLKHWGAADYRPSVRPVTTE